MQQFEFCNHSELSYTGKPPNAIIPTSNLATQLMIVFTALSLWLFLRRIFCSMSHESPVK